MRYLHLVSSPRSQNTVEEDAEMFEEADTREDHWGTESSKQSCCTHNSQ